MSAICSRERIAGATLSLGVLQRALVRPWRAGEMLAAACPCDADERRLRAGASGTDAHETTLKSGSADMGLCR